VSETRRSTGGVVAVRALRQSGAQDRYELIEKNCGGPDDQSQS
jgi:hypothetical protein